MMSSPRNRLQASPRLASSTVSSLPLRRAGQGALELKRESRMQDGAEMVTDSASGTIVTTDDVGCSRFGYTKTSLEGPGLAPGEWLVGLHVLSMIVTNTSGR